MKNAYCTGASPWESHTHPMVSGTWNQIMYSITLAQLHMAIDDTENWI